MSEKSARYLLLALIAMMAITGLCYATPTPMNTRDAKNETNSESAPPFARQYDINNNIGTADGPVNYPIGRLEFTLSSGKRAKCTASVINTPNGNIGLTAAHCILNSEGKMYTDMIFSPGYNNGQDGPRGRIPVAVAKVPDGFLTNSDYFDYGLMRFDFQDPSGDGHPLQAYTGALGWKLNIGTTVQTVGFGYPRGGKLPNCPNDGGNLCRYDGTAKLGFSMLG